PVQGVVVTGDCLAQLPEAGDRRVLLIGLENLGGKDARGCARQRAGLWLPLAEVRPVGRFGAPAEPRRLRRHVDHAGARYRGKRREHLYPYLPWWHELWTKKRHRRGPGGEGRCLRCTLE